MTTSRHEFWEPGLQVQILNSPVVLSTLDVQYGCVIMIFISLDDRDVEGFGHDLEVDQRKPLGCSIACRIWVNSID